MSQLNRISSRDLESLSAFLDGQLTRAQAAHLEARLGREPSLLEALEELRWTSGLLRSLPAIQVPRSFAVRAATARVRRTSWYPAAQLGTALAGIALVAVVGLDVVQSGLAGGFLRALGAQAPAMEAPSEAGAELFAAQIAETPTASMRGAEEAEDRLTVPAGTAAPGLPAAVAPTPSPTQAKTGPAEPMGEAALRSAPVTGAASDEIVASESIGWPTIRYIEIGLGMLTVILAGLTLAQRRPFRDTKRDRTIG